MSARADEVWAIIAGLMSETRSDYRRSVIDAVGMPFSRVRVMWRLQGGALSLKALADAATMDAPAATVAVNDLEARGLVTRTVNPASAREKVVAITPAGQALLKRVAALPQPAPSRIAELSDAELDQLERLVRPR